MVYRQTELAIQWQKSSRAVMVPAKADWFLQFKTKALCDSAAPCNVAAFHQANNPGKPLIPCVCNAALDLASVLAGSRASAMRFH